MPEIIVEPDCDNAPKKLIVRDLNVAFAENDVETILALVTDDIVWEIVGDKTITGREAFTAALERMNAADIASVTIRSIITHGREAAANGEIRLKDGSAYGFADVYHFSSASGSHFKRITSYNIELPDS